MTDRTTLFDRALPSGYRQELRSLVESEPVKTSKRAGTILLFQLGHLRLALPSRVAAAVGPVLHIARIPHRSGTVLLGLVAFRGEILPCCSLARVLDVVQSQSAAARTLILEESPGRRWAVPIDAVLGIRPAPDHSQLSGVVSPLAPHWLLGSSADENGSFDLLDSETLFRQITLATA
jgi:chemotaxis-related protein WspD